MRQTRSFAANDQIAIPDRFEKILAAASMLLLLAATTAVLKGHAEWDKVPLIGQGSFSFIHILPAWTIIQAPVIVWRAKTRNIAKHRSAVRGMVTGALLIAGFFTFPFNRMLGQWLFG